MSPPASQRAHYSSRHRLSQAPGRSVHVHIGRFPSGGAERPGDGSDEVAGGRRAALVSKPQVLRPLALGPWWWAACPCKGLAQGPHPCRCCSLVASKSRCWERRPGAALSASRPSYRRPHVFPIASPWELSLFRPPSPRGAWLTERAAGCPDLKCAQPLGTGTQMCGLALHPWPIAGVRVLPVGATFPSLPSLGCSPGTPLGPAVQGAARAPGRNAAPGPHS